MRKFFPVLLGTVVVAAPMHAQARIGVLGGFVSSGASISDGAVSFNPSSRSGFAAGITVTATIAPDIAVGPDLMYVQKGYKVNSSGNTFSVKGSYIEVPVLVHALFGTGPVRFVVLGGPAVAFKTSCTEEDSKPGAGTLSLSCSEAGNNYKSTDFSVMFGGGVRFGQFAVTARYDLGLVNVDSDAPDGTSVKNHALLILLGYHFRK
ncbi:MAG TPA: porin family protein [Gemmatimonadales bacterium]